MEPAAMWLLLGIVLPQLGVGPSVLMSHRFFPLDSHHGAPRGDRAFTKSTKTDALGWTTVSAVTHNDQLVAMAIYGERDAAELSLRLASDKRCRPAKAKKYRCSLGSESLNEDKYETVMLCGSVVVVYRETSTKGTFYGEEFCTTGAAATWKLDRPPTPTNRPVRSRPNDEVK